MAIRISEIHSIEQIAAVTDAGNPVIHIRVTDKQRNVMQCVVPVSNGTKIGMDFIKASEAASTDAGILQVLTKTHGIDEERARSMIQEIRQHMVMAASTTNGDKPDG
jgi:hypothetical protein